MFCLETVTWRHLNHPNVVPFLGATLDPPQLVSVWMPGGNLTEYVNEHPDNCRLALVSFFYHLRPRPHPPCQLHDVAEGLSYLHSRSVVHGDIKGVCVRYTFAGN